MRFYAELIEEWETRMMQLKKRCNEDTQAMTKTSKINMIAIRLLVVIYWESAKLLFGWVLLKATCSTTSFNLNTLVDTVDIYNIAQVGHSLTPDRQCYSRRTISTYRYIKCLPIPVNMDRATLFWRAYSKFVMWFSVEENPSSLLDLFLPNQQNVFKTHL